MSQTYYAILTAVGEAKLANAAALGTTLQLTHMAVGDGKGATPQPSRTQTALVHENRRGPLNSLFVDPANPSQIVAEHIIPEDVGGWWIREIGLYDTAGDLCAVANCPDTYKPVLASGSGRIQTIRMVLIVSNAGAVQLKIDPAVVLASRGYVDQVMGAHAAAADPHPQYLTNEEGDAKVAAAVAALVGPAPAVLDTLGELAAALGDDPKFAATMALALADKAPLAGAQLRGEPTAPTPPQFDNSDRLATTAAVKAAGLTFSGVAYMNSLPAVVDATLAGKLIVINGGAASTVALPLSSAVPRGATITLVNESTFAQAITRQGADIIIAGNSNSANAYTMEAGTFAVFIADAGGWHMGLRTAQLGLTGAFAGTNNTLRFPGGQMLQFGTGVTNSSGVVSITFPLTFSSPPVVITGNVGGNFNHSISLLGNNAGFTDSLYISNTGAMAGAGITSFWLAIGK